MPVSEDKDDSGNHYKNGDDIVQRMPRRSLPVLQHMGNILRESEKGVGEKMKLYIYNLEFWNEKRITEHSCEVVAKNKVLIRDDGKGFPAMGGSRISKTPMPRLCDANNVVSLEPLTEEQVKEFFLKDKERLVEGYRVLIRNAEIKIERIKGAEFVKIEPLEKGEA